MNILHAIILGLIQGLTEFIPVSSSGHLLLYEKIFHLPIANDKAFDVILHAGTLLALLIYFWEDWLKILKTLGCWLTLGQTCKVDDDYLFPKLIIAMIPAIVIGLSFGDYIDQFFREEFFVGIFMFIIGIIFILVERLNQLQQKVNMKNAFLIGLFQSIALLPGVSRSGITISAGMFQGIKRDVAARFSFLLAFPAILGATILVGKEILNGKYSLPSIDIVLAGFLVSTITSYFCIKYLLQFLKRHSLRVFAYYLLALGLIVTIVFYG